MDKNRILVCSGTGCTPSISDQIIENLEKGIKNNNLEDQYDVVKTGCFGLCAAGPIVIVNPGDIFYTMVKPEDVAEIIDEHLVKGNTINRLLLDDSNTGEKIKAFHGSTFYQRQKRIALRNCGEIAPEDIEEYIKAGGYKALEKVIKTMTPEEVIDVLKKSGLRGRGGAGFTTGMKWEFTYKAQGDEKFVLCNADEGDPGAFMDRGILEGDPHSVIEAMIIAGVTVGSEQGYIYVRAEYPIAVKRLNIAIEQAYKHGFLGKNIMGSNHNFDLELRLGAGAFVCGEETALMRSVEGKRGEPRTRPPFPAVKGLWDKPTLLNNVETYANIPEVIINGPEWFSSIGTEKGKGTKVFALGGNISNTGLVEVPIGTTLREIVYDIGGGIPNNRKFKAAQTGGPSGGCIPASELDTPMEYEALIKLGTMMGSGGLIVMDDSNCMVDIAKFFLEFTVDESCGKCPPCRIGTKRMLEILNRITEGKGKEEDIEKLERLAKNIKASALCGLGNSAPQPVLSTIRYFKDEYLAHINEKRCPAGVCKALSHYSIDPEICKGCGLCAKNCGVGAISGQVKSAYSIDPEKCVKCGACETKCPFKAIRKG
jgi:NADP-reducing hydrogenase subunit HndC